MNTKKLLSTQAYDTIKRLIMELELPPSASVTITELASRLGISRTPIREALHRLEQDGLITRSPGRGIRVTPLYTTDIVKMFELAEGVEGITARLAAERASEKQLVDMHRCLQHMNNSLKESDLASWVKFDVMFHHVLLDMADNEYLSRAMVMVSHKIGRTRMLLAKLTNRADDSTSEHWQTYRAIVDRNPNKAEDVTKQHWRITRSCTLGFLRDYQGISTVLGERQGGIAVFDG